MLQRERCHNNRGFTLLEIILSIALIGILASAFFATFRNFQFGNDMDVVVSNIVQSARRAQLMSQGVFGEDDWGVKIFEDRLVIFKGTSFLDRDVSRDETLDFPSPFSASGLTEIVFREFSGEPRETGTISLSTASGMSREINVGAMGRLSY
jgi:prepilin-type N-terminal cleavage/methylation domain-containing protein